MEGREKTASLRNTQPALPNTKKICISSKRVAGLLHTTNFPTCKQQTCLNIKQAKACRPALPVCKTTQACITSTQAQLQAQTNLQVKLTNPKLANQHYKSAKPFKLVKTENTQAKTQTCKTQTCKTQNHSNLSKLPSL